jgi:hypothetical protein
VTVTVWSLYTALAAHPLRREELPSLHRLSQISRPGAAERKHTFFWKAPSPCYGATLLDSPWK